MKNTILQTITNVFKKQVGWMPTEESIEQAAEAMAERTNEWNIRINLTIQNLTIKDDKVSFFIAANGKNLVLFYVKFEADKKTKTVWRA